MLFARRAILIASLSGLCGCSALAALTGAGAKLDAYTLSALPQSDIDSQGPHLVVALPTSAGALATDRILIKPSAVQAQYLPDGRWTDPAPVLVQTLLLASLQNMGGFRLVDRTGGGLMPDYTLMTELQDFQAEPAGPGPGAVMVRVGATMTLIRESDLEIIATRRFVATAMASDDSTLALVGAFDDALRQVLTDAIGWTRSQTG